MSKRISNKKAKELMLRSNLKVCENGEVSWIEKISIKANGTTLVYSQYLGDVDCPIMMSKVATRVANLGL